MDIGAVGAAVAIPARDEALCLPSCLEALARQRSGHGRTVDPTAFAVLVLANNCSDATARVAREAAPRLPFKLFVAEAVLPPGLAHAGGARRAAMDAAAAMLGGGRAALLSTDADSRAAPDWLAANLAALAAGADAVAGAIEPDAAQFAALPPALRAREESETAYAALLDEMAWLIDPDPNDPWPRHGIHSGASMALTLGAYRRIGGLPAVPVGEDRALFDAVRRAGLLVRHCHAARVSVSCRLDGRAAGGMADTLLRRRMDAAAPTDPRLEAAADAFWRFRCRRVFRRVQGGAARPGDLLRLAFGVHLPPRMVARIGRAPDFSSGWNALEVASPALTRHPVSASALAREAERAELILRVVRGVSAAASTVAARPPGMTATGRAGSARTAPAA